METNQSGQDCDNPCTSSMCLKYNKNFYLVSEKPQDLHVCVLKDSVLGPIYNSFSMVFITVVRSDLNHAYLIET